MSEPTWLYTLLGLNRAGRILYIVLLVIAIPALTAWFVLVPRLRFSKEDERLFRAARHGDVAGIERSLSAGSRVDAAAPVDGKTALCRAAVFGHADAVRALLSHGADPDKRYADGRTIADIVTAARGDEHDPSRARALDEVAAVLRDTHGRR
jgi:ankyrin repeat protein